MEMFDKLIYGKRVKDPLPFLYAFCGVACKEPSLYFVSLLASRERETGVKLEPDRTLGPKKRHKLLRVLTAHQAVANLFNIN